MAAVAQIVLADALATPVNHTFIPLGADAKGVWWFEDQSAVAPIGNSRVSLSLTRPPVGVTGSKSADRVSRAKLTVHMPVLEVLSNNSAGYTPAPTVAYIARVNIEFVIPERATVQTRKDGRKYALGLLADPQVIAAIESLQPVW